MQEPGHGGRSSGRSVVVVVVTWGRGRGFGVVLPGRVLSQHSDPRGQLAVCGIKTAGRSQKAAIMLMRQKPGHVGSAGFETDETVVLVVVVDVVTLGGGGEWDAGG